MKVMFVCTGNSCRSPMAELYFNYLCEKDNRKDICANSSGLAAFKGAKISTPSKEVLDVYNIDSSNFKSQGLSLTNSTEADLIVVMTKYHSEVITIGLPEFENKVKLLMHYSDDENLKDTDVPDPFGGTTAHYQKIFNYMKKSIENLYNQLKG